MLTLLLLLSCTHAPPPPPLPTVAPEEAKVWAAQAQLAIARGDAEARDRALAWVERLDGGSPWAWLTIARLRAEAGDTERARAALAEARARSSDPAITEAAAALEARLR
jgi:predicted Zn-dependent protease